MMKFPQLTIAFLLFLPSAPLLASASEGRSAEGIPAMPADTFAVISVLPEMPLAVIHLASRTDMSVSSIKKARLVDEPTPSIAQQLPMVGAVRRRTGDRFNTTDSSHPNDFAICYRVSPRMGLQVIPGDPTPANFKLPVSTLANNTGVTVGMTLRLGTQR